MTLFLVENADGDGDNSVWKEGGRNVGDRGAGSDMNGTEDDEEKGERGGDEEKDGDSRPARTE